MKQTEEVTSEAIHLVKVKGEKSAQKRSIEDIAILAFRMAEAMLRPNGPFFTQDQVKEEVRHLLTQK